MDMIEKVSRAICAAAGQNPDDGVHSRWPAPPWTIYVDQAKAAITELREPSAHMLEAGQMVGSNAGGYYPWWQEIPAIWRAMIDAALHDPASFPNVAEMTDGALIAESAACKNHNEETLPDRLWTIISEMRRRGIDIDWPERNGY